MEYYFDRDDKLDRIKYAKFLETLLLHCDEYRREDSDGAYVIALDSPWGTGKTRFVKMLRNYLEDRTSKVEKDRPTGKEKEPLPPGENANFNVVYYNAWETDFSTDALEPLFYSLLQSPELAPDQFDAAGAEILKQFKNVAKEMLKAAGYALSHHFLGEAATSIIKAGIDGSIAKEENPYENYEKRFEKVSDFRSTLSAVIESTKQKKLVLIIDELDRCRPTFAIETLEIAKHLFAVPNLVFIFALDITQLSNSVKTIYGAEMDSLGYLCRFFDYRGALPNPTIHSYLAIQLRGLVPREMYYTEAKFNSYLVKYMSELQYKFSLSLREYIVIVSTYKMLFYAFLERYGDVSAHELYLLLLTLKYKKPETYVNLLSSQIVGELKEDYLFEKVTTGINSQTQTSRRLSLLRSAKRIGSLVFETYNCQDNTIVNERRFARFTSIEGQDRQLRYYIEPVKINADGFIFSPMENLGQVLYFEDLLKWDTIKGLTLGQYYYRRLEMFDFVLPADEEKTAR